MKRRGEGEESWDFDLTDARDGASELWIWVGVGWFREMSGGFSARAEEAVVVFGNYGENRTTSQWEETMFVLLGQDFEIGRAHV